MSRHTITLRFLLALLTAFIVCSSAHGDAAPPWASAGGGLEGPRNTTIRLVLESAVMDQFHNEEAADAWACRVEDTYTFINTGESEQTIQVKFSILTSFVDDPESTPLKNVYEVLKAAVDGTPVNVERFEVGEEGNRHFGAGFMISFAPKQQRVVAITLPVYENEKRNAESESPYAHFSYDFSGLSAWMGPLDRLDVRIDMPFPITNFNARARLFQSGETSIVDNRMLLGVSPSSDGASTADLSNPSLDVFMVYPKTQAELVELQKRLEAHPDDASVNAMIASLLAYSPKSKAEYQQRVETALHAIVPGASPSRVLLLADLWKQVRTETDFIHPCGCSKEVCAEIEIMAGLDKAAGNLEEASDMDDCCCNEVATSDSDTEPASDVAAKVNTVEKAPPSTGDPKNAGDQMARNRAPAQNAVQKPAVKVSIRPQQDPHPNRLTVAIAAVCLGSFTLVLLLLLFLFKRRKK